MNLVFLHRYPTVIPSSFSLQNMGVVLKGSGRYGSPRCSVLGGHLWVSWSVVVSNQFETACLCVYEVGLILWVLCAYKEGVKKAKFGGGNLATYSLRVGEPEVLLLHTMPSSWFV